MTATTTPRTSHVRRARNCVIEEPIGVQGVTTDRLAAGIVAAGMFVVTNARTNLPDLVADC